MIIILFILSKQIYWTPHVDGSVHLQQDKEITPLSDLTLAPVNKHGECLAMKPKYDYSY